MRPLPLPRGAAHARQVTLLATPRTTTDLRRGRAAGALPGIAAVAVGTAAAFAIHRAVPSISPLVAAVVIGALAANVVPLPTSLRPGLAFASRRFLRIGIVLLGLQLSVREVVNLGGPGLAVVVVTVAITFVGTRWLGAKLGVSPGMSLLVATGYSICGASAIAAMEPLADAEEEEVAFSIALVTLFGTLAMITLPAISHPLGLDGARFGSWVGASVHDVAQVVATASTSGSDALRAAIVVKLTRVVLLAPLIAIVAIGRRRSSLTPATEEHARPSSPIVPLFVVLFLVAIVVRTAGVLSADALDVLATVEKVFLAAALVGLGSDVRIQRLRMLGGRPLLLGLMSWILVAAVSGIGVALTVSN
jgi:uncharacterized integral membrane protein (TIGR00698 family)